MPEESFMLLMGQWATPVPVLASTRSSSSLKWMPWANHTSLPVQPKRSMYSRGRMPSLWSMKFSSSLVSHRWVCSRTPYWRARMALWRSSSADTEKGEQGARAMRCMAP